MHNKAGARGKSIRGSKTEKISQGSVFKYFSVSSVTSVAEDFDVRLIA
jgi:hypothetical protein